MRKKADDDTKIPQNPLRLEEGICTMKFALDLTFRYTVLKLTLKKQAGLKKVFLESPAETLTSIALGCSEEFADSL